MFGHSRRTLTITSLALVMHAFAHDQLPKAVAVWGAAGAAAGALGPTLGAVLINSFGWRWAFFLNLPVGLYTIADGLRHLRESSAPDVKVPSFVGVALVATAAALLSYGLIVTADSGWLGATTIVLLAAGLVTVGLFVWHQARTPAPALDLDLFKARNFSLGNVTMLIFGTAFSAMFFSSILFLTQVWGWSTLKAGMGVAPGPAIVAVVAPVMGNLARRIGQRPILIAGGLLYAFAGLWRLTMLQPDANYVVDYFPSMLFSGLGVACVFPQLSSLVAQALPRARSGVGGAVLQAGRQFGGTFGVALTIALLGADGIATVARFDRIWWLLIGGGVATSILTLPTRVNQLTLPVRPIPSPGE